MLTYVNSLIGKLVSGLTLPPVVITADVATNPTASVDMVTALNQTNGTIHLGTIHADTTGVVQFVESATGANGSWVAITGATASFTGTSDNTILRVSFTRTRRFVGALVDLSGTTQSAAISIEVSGMLNYTPE